MKNLLNLKKKDPSDIVIVEKIVLKNRSMFFEIFRMLTIIAVASGIVWGISNADILNTNDQTTASGNDLVGIYGVVTGIADNSLSIDDSQGSKYQGIDVYMADLTNLKEVKTNDDVPVTLSVSDLKVGDTIIAKGMIDGSTIKTDTIISFSASTTTPDLTATSTDATTTDATTTATSTTDDTSTTTDSISTTTDATSTASSTLSDIVKDIVDSVVDALTGTTTSTSTDSTSTTTATSTDTTATTTDTTSTTTDATSTDTTSSSTATSTSIVDTVIGAVQDTVQNIISTVSGTSTDTTSQSQTTDQPSE